MDKLGDLWKEKFNSKGLEEQRVNSVAWATRMINVTKVAIKDKIENFRNNLDTYVEVGEFSQNQLKRVGEGDYFPNREDLTNGAELFYDWCEEQNLKIKVGGDFKMSGVWCAPYEIYVTFK